jgi:hypothetical protein
MHRSGTGLRGHSHAAAGISLCRRDDAVITRSMSRVAAPLSFTLVAVAQMAFVPVAVAGPHDALIAKHAAANGVPEQLIHRVIKIESRGNARAVHAGNYGLMQIRLGTARGVGYSGDAQGLLDPDTNLTYAVKYLAGAYRAAGCDEKRTVSYYQRGYYGAALRECGGSPMALPSSQIAQADAKAATKVKPTDVIKPKVVRTETIAPPQSGAPTVARPTGSFEPKRVAPPPVQPVAMPKPEPVLPKPVEPKLAEPKVAAPAGAVPGLIVPEPAAKFELASVPMPPVRPEFEPAPKKGIQPARRSARVHERTDKKLNAEAKAKPEPNGNADAKPDPVGAVSSFLKKLVTPDKNARKSTVEADADPPSHVQPPQ